MVVQEIGDAFPGDAAANPFVYATFAIFWYSSSDLAGSSTQSV